MQWLYRWNHFKRQMMKVTYKSLLIYLLFQIPFILWFFFFSQTFRIDFLVAFLFPSLVESSKTIKFHQLITCYSVRKHLSIKNGTLMKHKLCRSKWITKAEYSWSLEKLTDVSGNGIFLFWKSTWFPDWPFSITAETQDSYIIRPSSIRSFRKFPKSTQNLSYLHLRSLFESF